MDEGLLPWNKLYSLLQSIMGCYLFMNSTFFKGSVSVFVSMRDSSLQFPFAQFLCCLYLVLESGCTSCGEYIGEGLLFFYFLCRIGIDLLSNTGYSSPVNDTGLEIPFLEILKLQTELVVAHRFEMICFMWGGLWQTEFWRLGIFVKFKHIELFMGLTILMSSVSVTIFYIIQTLVVYVFSHFTFVIFGRAGFTRVLSVPKNFNFHWFLYFCFSYFCC